MLSKTGLLHSARARSWERQTAKCETKIENQAEPLEAMAHSVKTQIEQLVRRCEKPNWGTVELRETCPSPCSVHVELESVGVLHVVVQLEIERIPAPGAGGNHRHGCWEKNRDR